MEYPKTGNEELQYTIDEMFAESDARVFEIMRAIIDAGLSYE